MTEPATRDTFDPYHKWLGISPKDQPPHHYRLLAIDLFESDAEVISAAADKQMAFIRSFQTGKNSQLSQKILNEISTARICLLNTAKKTEYDLKLRARLAAKASASGIGRAMPIPAAAAADSDEIVVLAELAESGNHGPLPKQSGGGEGSQIRAKKVHKATIVPLAALAAMLVVSAVAVAVVMSRKPDTEVSQSAQDSGSKPSQNAEHPHVEPTTQGDKPAAVDTGKPAPNKGLPQQPLNSRDSTSGATATPPSEAGAAPDSSGKEAIAKPSEKNRAEVKPGSGNVTIVSTPGSAATPGTHSEAAGSAKPVEAKPSEAEKPKTPEEFDKEIADAQTPEEYRAVAGEALRAAGRAMDGHREVTAKQLILKSLVAARKSGDLKLIYQATRARIKPESVNKILADGDNHTED